MTDGIFGEEVRKSFDICHQIPEMMLWILEDLSWDQLQQLRTYNEKREGTFEQKLKELCGLAGAYCIMDDLRYCLAALQREIHEDELEKDE